jgi:hypothetical protein
MLAIFSAGSQQAARRKHYTALDASLSASESID